MTPQRTPRQVAEPDETPSPAGRRLLYTQALRASEQEAPTGAVALVLLEASLAPGTEHLSEGILGPVTTKLGSLLHRRLRSLDLLVRTADTELAVLLAQAHLGVAAGFSERMRQPIEQSLREMGLASKVTVCMGLAASPPNDPWHPEELIELTDFRMRAARARIAESRMREWALAVDGEARPEAWAASTQWPATGYITSDFSAL